MKGDVRPYRKGDEEELAPKMRQADVTEVAKLGYSPLWALKVSIAACESPKTIILEDGTVCGIFGVNRLSDTIGRPWMMASDDLLRVRKQFLERCAGYIDAEPYDTLVNIIWEGNTTHIRWLKYLGFMFEPSKTPEFLQFWRFRES